MAYVNSFEHDIFLSYARNDPGVGCIDEGGDGDAGRSFGFGQECGVQS